MARCPACSLDNPDDATQCARCHLSGSLFEAVREAAGSSESNPEYAKAIGEILAAVDASPTDEEGPDGAVLASPSRFPPLPSGAPSATAGPAPERGEAPTGLPVLPPGGDVPRLMRQVNDYLQLARRQGIDLNEFAESAREAVLAQDRETLEVLNRELFVHLAASLTQEYEGAVGRSHEISGLVSTSTPDVELESCRAALAMGDLAGAQRRLRHIEQELTDLEDHWATAQILVAECDLLAGTIRELGGDPAPALGPLAEGRRLARDGDREGAEPVLARAALALWSVLNPLFMRELARVKEAMLRQRGQGRDITASVLHLRQLATDLRHRNFAAAIAAYRQLRVLAGETEGVPAPAAAVTPADVE
ncbi:MAG: hypothetical protein L3K06_01415 [Thermoplasmata archaeon]|nr:hypothetical protein [Thermoplasmata archaeon]MCI4354009.1 hypothetical protein [Thermoplasmata archaeon]